MAKGTGIKALAGKKRLGRVTEETIVREVYYQFAKQDPNQWTKITNEVIAAFKERGLID